MTISIFALAAAAAAQAVVPQAMPATEMTQQPTIIAPAQATAVAAQRFLLLSASHVDDPCSDHQYDNHCPDA